MSKIAMDDKKIRFTICLSKQVNYELQVLADDSGLSRSSYLAYIVHKLYKDEFPDSPPVFNDREKTEVRF